MAVASCSSLPFLTTCQIRFTSSPDEKGPYHPSSNLQRVLHPLSTLSICSALAQEEDDCTPDQQLDTAICSIPSGHCQSISHETAHPASTTLTGLWSQMAHLRDSHITIYLRFHKEEFERLRQMSGYDFT